MKIKIIVISVVAISTAAIGYLAWLQSGEKSKVGNISHLKDVGKSNRPSVKISPLLASITSSSIHWEDRIKSVNLLPVHLDADTTTSLFEYLTVRPGDEKPEIWYLISNEIMQALRKRELKSGQYTERLTALLESDKVDPVIRDYAVQHLSQWIAGIDPSARETNSAMATFAFDAMCTQAAALKNGQLTMVGTTLNALTDAMINGEGAFKAKHDNLGEIALRVAASKDGSVATFNRSTALQAAARLNTPDLPNLCRTLLNDKEVAPDIRLGSIAALGVVGNAEDQHLLESFAADSSFKYAASVAIKRIQERFAIR